MGLFDSLQNIVGGVSDIAQNTLGDAVGGITDIPVVQDLQEQATAITDTAAESVTSVTEQGQNTIEDITSTFEL